MVGIIEKVEHITTQYFREEGDAIILLGDWVHPGDALNGLGGSAYLQVVHRLKTGTPPTCDLEPALLLVEGLRALIYGGSIKSAHDCSEGGLAVCVAEACFRPQTALATPNLIGATLDLTAATGLRTDALLFGESHHRVVVTTSALESGKVVAQAHALGLSARRIGTVGGGDLVLQLPGQEFRTPIADLYDGWWNTIARLMA